MCWVSAPTNDRLRVEDGSESLLQTSHADLLVLENPNVDILAFHSKSDEFPVLGVKHGKVCLPPKSSAEAKR
jgi:hypothetical protein